MTEPPVLVVTGSPSDTSRSALVARRVAAVLAEGGAATHLVSLRDLDASDVIFARTSDPRVAAFVDAARAAPAIVLATPVYKATYSGGLKALVDLIPPDALAGKPALGIATTKLAAHGPLVRDALHALFAFFGAPPVEEGLVVLDDEITPGAAPAFAQDAEARITGAGRALLARIGANSTSARRP